MIVAHVCMIIMNVTVFIETFDTVLEYTKEGQLRCTAKAPTNSTISLRHNDVPIAISQNTTADCDSLPRISVTSEKLDDQFSLFSATISVRKGRR